MVCINKAGFPVKISEKGVDRIIPYDGNPYTIDDSCFDAFKDLFHIIEQPKVSDELVFDINTIDRIEDMIRKTKPLADVHVKRMGDKILKKVRPVGRPKENRPGVKCWEFISPTGEIITPPKFIEFCKANNIPYGYIYKILRTKRTDTCEYNGWKITHKI